MDPFEKFWRHQVKDCTSWADFYEGDEMAKNCAANAFETGRIQGIKEAYAMRVSELYSEEQRKALQSLVDDAQARGLYDF